MQTIRDDFIQKLKGSIADAIGVYCILQMGISAQQQLEAQYPAATLRAGAGNSGIPGVRAVKYAPTHAQIQEKLSNNRELILELYLS